MEKLNNIYMLSHNYNRSTYDIESKLIGVYTSYENAVAEAQRYILLDGFKDYPLSCFSITKYAINACYWKEGFVSRTTSQGLSCDIPLWASTEKISVNQTPEQFVMHLLFKYGKTDLPVDDLPSSERGALKRYASIIVDQWRKDHE